MGSAGTGSARGSDGGPNERRAWGVGREQVGCVAKTHRDAERCVIARSTHPIGSRPSPAGARPGSTPRWNQGDPPCSFPAWPPGPRQGWAASSDRFWLCELRVSQHFSTFYGSSVQSMGTQLNALPALPGLARGVSGCLNSAFLGLQEACTRRAGSDDGFTASHCGLSGTGFLSEAASRWADCLPPMEIGRRDRLPVDPR